MRGSRARLFAERPPQLPVGSPRGVGYSFSVMSAREVIRLIEALPQPELREVLEYCHAKEASLETQAGSKRMSFQDAKKHVFTTYRDVLEKLAK